MSYYGPPGGDDRARGRGHGGSNNHHHPGGDYRADSTTDRTNNPVGSGMRGGDDFNGRNARFNDLAGRYGGSQGGHGGHNRRHGGGDEQRGREASRRHDDYNRDRDARRYDEPSSRQHDGWDRPRNGYEREYSRDRYGGREATRYDREPNPSRYNDDRSGNRNRHDEPPRRFDDRGPPPQRFGGNGDGYRECEPPRGRHGYDSRTNSGHPLGPPRRGYNDRGRNMHPPDGRNDHGGGSYSNGNGNSQGTRDMGRMGDRNRGMNGGGRGSGSEFSRRGNGGGRGGQFRGMSVPVDLNAKEANANIICATVMNNFRFYHYGIDGSTSSGKLIDSRRRKAELFNFGMFDEKHGLLARNGMSNKEIEDLRRVTFFEGSFLYCSRQLPFVGKLPFSLVGAKVPENNAPPSDNGDTMTFTTLSIFSAPEKLVHNKKSSGPDGIVVDLRCSDCTQAFKTKESLLSHCQAGGHSPQMDLDDTKPSSSEQFIGFCNVALQRAMGERMARWGREYIDPKNWTEPTERNGRQVGVRIFRAFSCEFGIHKPLGGGNTLTLTVDLRAKLIRTKSLMDNLCCGNDPRHTNFNHHDIMKANNEHQGEVVICTYDKKCYSVIELDFDNSPASKPVEGTGMSHAEYFRERKGIDLKYPDSPPIVAVLGRGNRKIYLPAELVCANELSPSVKQKLPMIASFTPPQRDEAIEEMRKYLVPGAQKTKGVGGGLLPALGIILEDSRMKVDVEVLPLPLLKAAGVTIPKEKGNMWAPIISRANYRVDRGVAVEMKVLVVHHNSLTRHARQVYEKIRDLVNGHNSHYRFGQTAYEYVAVGDDDRHWRPVQDYMSRSIPENVFVLDLVKPARRQALDAAYSVVKYILTKNGYLSQFLNFNTHDHANPRDQKASRKSTTILQGLARQILSKCGARVWWVNLPKEIPLPAVFVGVDVFHSPRKYNVAKGKKTAKESVAAVVVQVVKSHDESQNTHTEIFSQTFRREVGKEMGLGNCMRETVKNALRLFKVNPMSCVVWRDGVGDPAIKVVAGEEIPAVRDALSSSSQQEVPLSYIVVQKRISTKFLSVDGKSAIPLGSLVVGLQGPEHTTFYINGTAPPYSTPKPARFVIAKTDESFNITSKTIADLSWALCHDYSNWTGAIKLPSPVQMAHKLAELAGMMDKGGEDIDHEKYAGKAHFL